MRCPFCKEDNDKVINSRTAGDGLMVKRRRECLNCKRRYTTHERIEESSIRVVKKDGRRIPFDRSKIMAGLIRACEKRPVSTDAIEDVVAGIESHIHDKFDREVSTEYIGEYIIKKLKELDHVAYVRFASVYRDFKDVSDFVEEAKPLIKSGSKRRKG
jgi:transcriptional repressor NrdR